MVGTSGDVLTDLVRNNISEGGVAENKPPPGRDAIGLVLELLRPELMEVVEECLLDEIGMEASHAVDGVGADDGEIGHVDALASSLLND